MNRKGLDFGLWLLLLGLLTASFVVYNLYNITIKQRTIEFGDNQVALNNAFTEGERFLLFVDSAAKDSVLSAMEATARVAGGSACGSKEGIPIWNEDRLLCSKLDYYGFFINQLNNKFNNSLGKYSSANRLSFKYDYDYFVNSSVYGFSAYAQAFNVRPPEQILQWYSDILGLGTNVYGTAAIGRYFVRPSFVVDVNPRFDVYDSVRDAVSRIASSCFDANCAISLVPSGVLVSSSDGFVFLNVPLGRVRGQDLSFNVAIRLPKPPLAS